LFVRFTRDKGGWATETGSIAALMREAACVLANGGSLAVFPEGARSSTGSLQEFKDGFFRLAIEKRVPIG
jgi:1-acyl-sn-glycerol-3-phosphate acyltransferase